MIQDYRPGAVKKPDTSKRLTESEIGDYIVWAYENCTSNPDWRTLQQRLQEEYLYRNAKQSTFKYMPFMEFGGGVAANNQTPTGGIVGVANTKENIGGTNASSSDYISIDWRIWPVAPKLIDIIKELVTKQGYFPSANAKDPLSQDEKAREEFKAKADVALAQLGLADQINQAAGMEMIPPNPAAMTSMDEVEEYMEDFKLAQEAAHEVAVDAILSENHFEDQYEWLIDDIITHSMGLACHRSSSGKVITERVDLRSAIFDMASNSMTASHCGYVKSYSPTALRDFASRFGKTWSDDEFKKVVNQAFTNAPNQTWWAAMQPQETIETWRRIWETSGDSTACVYVAYVTFYTNCTDKYSESDSPAGGKKYKKLKPGATKQAIGVEFQEVNEGYWIVGTNQFFGCQLMHDQPRKKADPKKRSTTPLPFTLHRSQQEQSIVRRLFGALDNIQKLQLKRQQVMQQIKAGGLAVNDYVFSESFNLQDGDSITAWADALKLYTQKHFLKWKGAPGVALPITELKATGLEEYLIICQGMVATYEELRELAGLNQFTDATTPDKKALVGIGQISTMGTNNAINAVTKCGIRLVRDLVEGSIGRLHCIAEYNGLDHYATAINARYREIIEVSAKSWTFMVDFTIECNPDEQTMQAVMAELNTQKTVYIETKGGFGIKMEDYLKAVRAKSFKQKIQILKMATRKVERENQERASRNNEENRRAAAEAAQMKGQIDQETLKLEGEMESVKAQSVAQASIILEQAKHANAMELQAATLEGELIKQDDQQDFEMRKENMKKVEDRKTQAVKLQADVLIAQATLTQKAESDKIKAASKPATTPKK